MKTIIRLVVAGIITASFLMLLQSCNELKEGTVTKMHIEPARDYIYMMPIPHTIRSGKTSSTYYTYIPIMMHDDPDYVITLHGVTDDNEERTEDWYVSESTYSGLKTGRKFCVSEDCSKESNDDTKIE